MFLEECDAFLGRHLGDFVGREIAEFESGAVDGCLFLLFLSGSGDIADCEQKGGGGGGQWRSAGDVQCENGFIFAADGDLDGWSTGFRQPDSAEVGAISGCESLLERLTGVIVEIRSQFREGIVMPANAELFIEECDAIREQLEESERAHGGIGETLGGRIIDDEPVGVGIGECGVATVHHFCDFSGRGDFGRSVIAE